MPSDSREAVATLPSKRSGRVLNPKTGEYERPEDATPGGYKRRYLELLRKVGALGEDVVDLRNTPVLTFDLERWDAEERDGTLLLVKRDAESRFDEMVLEATDAE